MAQKIQIDLLANVNSALKSVKRFQKEAGVGIAKVTREFDRLNEKSQKFRDNVGSATAKAAIGFAGLSAAIGGSLAAFSSFEDIGVQFKVLTGDIESANKAVKELKDFAASTPFQFGDIAQAGKQLLGFGFQTEELKQRLQEIGDVAAASGKPIQEISLIFGQVAAAGKLTGERLLQFQERAIPIGPAIAKTLGVAESAVKDLVSKGVVDFKTFQIAFQSLSKEGGFAFGGLEQLSLTLSGKISTLKDNFVQLAANIGDRFAPVAKTAVDLITRFIQAISGNKTLITFITTVLAVGAALTGIGVVIGTIAIAVSKLSVILGAAKIAVLALGTSFGAAFKFSIVGAVILAVGYAITDLALNWEKRIKQMKAVWTVFKKVIKDPFGDFTFGGELAKEFYKIDQSFKNSAKTAKEESDKIKNSLNGIGKGRKGKELPLVSKETLAKVQKALKKTTEKGTKDGAESGFQKASKKMQKQLGVTFKDVFSGIAAGKDGARSLFTKVGSSFANMIAPGVGEAIGPLLDVFAQGPEATRDMIQGFIRGIPEIIRNFVASIPVIISTLVAEIPRLVTELVNAVPFIATELASAIVGQAPFMGIAIVAGIIKNIPTMIEGFVKGFRDGIGNALSGVKDFFNNIVKNLGGVFSRGVKELFRKIFDVYGKIFDIYKSVFSAIGEFLFNAIVDAFKKIADPLRKAFSGDFSDLANKAITFGLTGGLSAIPGIEKVPVVGNIVTGVEDFIGSISPFKTGTRSTEGSGTTNALLEEILIELKKPQQVQSTIEVDGQSLADIILELNRNNLRLA